MKKQYTRLNCSSIAIEPTGALLFQSGAAGARIEVQAGVDPWLESNEGIPVEITIDGSPMEF